MRCASNLASLGRAFTLAAAAGLLGLLLTGASCRAGASELSADEYSLKGAFLYNLAKFVDWPPGKFKQDDSPVVIGVVGQEGFERVSAVVRDKMIGKHPVLVRLLGLDEEIKDCHILFVTRAQKQRATGMVDTANKAAVLTVGETDTFLESGGMIRFYLEADNLRLEINDECVRQAGLSIKANALSALINKGIAKLRKA